MANAIHRRTSAAQQLERTEKEMARLKGRLEELRRSFLGITSGDGKVRRPEAIREFCREVNITMDTFTRLVGASKKTVRTWLAGHPPNRANQRNVSEISRLFDELSVLVTTSH